MKFSFKQLRPQRLGPNEQGFSLIETLVVIAIMAIAAGMTVPNLLSYRPAYELNRAANDLYSNLQWARLVAIRESTNCGIVINPASTECEVEDGEPEPNYCIVCDSHGNSPLIPVNMAEKYAYAPVTVSGSAITFDARGISNNNSITVTNVTNGVTKSFDIVTSTVGRVRKVRN